MNLWMLTEERPKKDVIKQIISKVAKDKKLEVKFGEIRIKPVIEEKKFTFTYKVIGANIESVDNIFMKIVSGYGSFIDFLIFLQTNEPDRNSIPLYAIEETKTSDAESRNTGVYQRCSKFVYIDFYYPNCKKIMLYNIQTDNNKKLHIQLLREAKKIKLENPELPGDVLKQVIKWKLKIHENVAKRLIGELES